jgi:hypothetical protein
MRVAHHSYDEIFENENGGVFSSLKFLVFNKDLKKTTRYVDASHKITASTLKKEKNMTRTEKEFNMVGHACLGGVCRDQPLF